MPEDKRGVRDEGDNPPDMPAPARIQDYLLGGTGSYSIDRAAVQEISAVLGDKAVRDIARENRAFHGRAVDYFIRECGIDQILEVGPGLPSPYSTHEVAGRIRPGTRIVYADNDAQVLARSRVALRDDPDIAIVPSDIRDPESVLDHPSTNTLIDFSRPVAVLFLAVLHSVPSAGHSRYRDGDADPAAIMAAVRDRVAPGSYVAYSGVTQEGPPALAVTRAEEVYANATAPLIFRTREQVTALFDGWHLIPPGVVRPWRWRPGPGQSPHTNTLWGAVGIKEPAP
jgi:hypothetical protein